VNLAGWRQRGATGRALSREAQWRRGWIKF
jgi:hypothetical protein